MVSASYSPTMSDQWNEKLECPQCQATGRATLVQKEDETPTVVAVPDGFRVTTTRNGPIFYCADCNVPAKP
jgi:hypothetical protein